MLTVRTLNEDGSSPFWLAQLGAVSNLRYNSGWPYGCIAASFDLDLPVDVSHYSLNPGRLVEVYDGIGRVWGGTLHDPQRGTPWHINATGYASLADDYLALTAGPSIFPSPDPGVAVPQAVIRGLPWKLYPGLTYPATAGASAQQPDNLTQVLNASTLQAGTRWALFADAALTFAADPTSPSYLLHSVDTPGSRTVDNYVTDLYVRYLDSSTTPATTQTVRASSSYRPFGTYERVVDITSQGAISASTAQTNAQMQLAASTRNLTYSGSVTVQPGALLNLGGVPVSLPSVQAGQMLEVRGGSQDPSTGEVNFTTVIRWVIGDAEYDDGTQTLKLTPLGAKPNDLLSVLTRLMGQPTDNTQSPAYAP